MPTMDSNYLRKLLCVANSFENCSIKVNGETLEVIGHDGEQETVYRACGDIELESLVEKRCTLTSPD